MRDLIDLGAAPSLEDCAQVGTDDYWERARKECRAYIGVLRRTFGDEPDDARLSIKSNPHDFGTYLSVVCYYDDTLPASVDYASRCDAESPETWDQAALSDLGRIDPSHHTPKGE